MIDSVEVAATPVQSQPANGSSSSIDKGSAKSTSGRSSTNGGSSSSTSGSLGGRPAAGANAGLAEPQQQQPQQQSEPAQQQQPQEQPQLQAMAAGAASAAGGVSYAAGGPFLRVVDATDMAAESNAQRKGEGLLTELHVWRDLALCWLS